MNRQRVLKLANKLKKIKEEGNGHWYNQKEYMHKCGTPSCLAGWAAAEYLDEHDYIDRDELPTYTGWQIMHLAQKWLGINFRMKCQLFDSFPDIAESPTIEEAIDTLKFLAATGKVQWPKHLSYRAYK